MLVSIVIPIYNVELYLERCLESVYRQTYSDLEVILVDDCTQDNSMEIAHAIIKKYDAYNFTKIVKHDKNKGLSVARNTGINASTGDYLYFLDSDDEIFLYTIENLIELALKTNSDLSIGNVKVVNLNNSTSLHDFTNKYPDQYLLDNNISIRNGFFTWKWHEVAWNKLVKKNFIMNNNLFFEPGLYHEDILWSFNISLLAKRVSFLTQETYIYYLRQNSITTNPNKKNIQDRIFIFNKLVETSLKNEKLLDNDNFRIYMLNFKYLILLLTSSYDYSFFKQCFREMKYMAKPKNKSLKIVIKLILFSSFLPKNLIYKFLDFYRRFQIKDISL